MLNDVQDTWDNLLPQAGASYRHAKLVLYRDSYPSGCGRAESATGPFYCPDDEKVYLDLAFFDELRQRFGAPGEFAGLSVVESGQVRAVLQPATADGGVHLVETIVAGQEAISEDELRARYSGWEVSFLQEPGASKTFVAKKIVM